MKPKMAMRSPVCGPAADVRKGLARFFARMKEREFFDRWHSSKTKKEEAIGKRAEFELRRRMEGNEYHRLRESKRKGKELSKVAERFRRFILSLAPLEEGPKRSETGVGVT